MLLTPGQARALAGVPIETLRYWKSQILELRGRRGRGAHYSPGDVLALSVLRIITAELGCDIRYLAPIVSDLFQTCRPINWPRLESSTLCIDIRQRRILLGDAHQAATPLVAVPMAPMVSQLRLMLMQGADGQAALPLAPVEVRRRMRS